MSHSRELLAMLMSGEAPAGEFHVAMKDGSEGFVLRNAKVIGFERLAGAVQFTVRGIDEHGATRTAWFSLKDPGPSPC